MKNIRLLYVVYEERQDSGADKHDSRVCHLMEAVSCMSRQRTQQPTNMIQEFVISWRLYRTLNKKDSDADEHSLRVCHLIEAI